MVTRSQQMLGFDSNYVPGWDCHGLPIEWKIEEENYRSKGKHEAEPVRSGGDDRVPPANAAPMPSTGSNVQREEFKRLGVEGDWDHPYTTMAFAAEAQIARELMKFAANGTLYRGSKPVMWSVVEKTALAEAEVEYEDYTSDTVWVKFPVARVELRRSAARTLPRWHSISSRTRFGRDLDDDAVDAAGQPRDQLLVEDRIRPLRVTDAPPDNWAKTGDLLHPRRQARRRRVQAGAGRRPTSRSRDVPADAAGRRCVCAHPLHGQGGYDFDVPLLDGDHVTDDTGTGFVHTAPGHGREDFDIWTANARALEARGINTAIPYTVDENGAFTEQAPGFTGKRVINDKGEKGDANEAVIKALVEAGSIIARGRLKHQYPHSWRSKKPVIFRNTPQWFIAMDKPITRPATATLRDIALRAIKATRWVPPQGENRITGMIESRPDWVISRQRAWGVPIAVFVREKGDGSAEILQDEARQRAHRRRLRAGRRRRLVRRPARASASSARAPTRTGRRSTTSRRLVRLRLDPRLRAGRPASISRRSPASSASTTAAPTP